MLLTTMFDLKLSPHLESPAELRAVRPVLTFYEILSESNL